jgi:hypothetical protein
LEGDISRLGSTSIGSSGSLHFDPASSP